MPSALRLLADINNCVASAAVSASIITAATDQAFRQPTTRTGTGSVRLTGGYTGAADTIIDIDIVAPTTGNERVTQPTFAGAGNGTMTVPTATAGSVAQTLTVALVDLGTETTAAQAIYGDLLLRARSAGTGGNSITLSITPNLTLSTAPIGALADALARETQEWSDQRLDFGALPLNPDGTLSTSCPRLVFGRDTSRVYRHYKRWDGDQWQYGVSPKLAAAYPAGAQVHTVTGTYTVVVTDGVTTESVSGTTLYAVLLALSASTLIEVVGVIANDQRPGGQAAIDLPVRTSAFALPVVKARDEMPDLTGLAVAETAPTEVLILECIDDAAINAETWAVKSKVAGALPAATTGVAYDGPYVDFTIPKGAISERPVEGSIAISATDLEGTGDPKAYPSICFYRPALGANASAKTLTLVWTARPADDCPCDSVPVTGRPSETYLGIDLGDDDAMSALAAGHQSRLEALISWHKTFVAGNTEVTASGELRAADLDLQLAQLAVNELGECLVDLYGTDATLTAPARANTTAYTLYQVVEPATRNNYRYRCTVAGTSGSSPPTWPVTIGTTVTDGGVTWTCASKIPEIAWDDVLSGLNTDLTGLATLSTALDWGVITNTWVASTAVVLNYLAEPRTPNGYYYECTTAGTTAASEPTWPTVIGNTVTDGTAVWTCRAVASATNRARTLATTAIYTTFNSGDICYYGGGYFKVLETFKTGATVSLAGLAYVAGAIYYISGSKLGSIMCLSQADTAAHFAASDSNLSGSTEESPGILRDPQTWAQRYLAACNYVRTLAGLLPKADAGLIPTAGSGVWSDPGDAYYWVIQGTQYLPVFNNRYYHSCKAVVSPDCGGTVIEPTYEFGFAIQVGCPDRLVAGDTITIVIGDLVIQRPYQVGDTYEIPLVMGGPLAFSGGVTGTDTLTWSVYSSTQGMLDPYPLTALEPAYSDGGLGFTIHRGTLDFALGDIFTFAVTVGEQFKWRRDSGSWSVSTAIAASVALADGLYAAFTAGPDPSFVLNDRHTFNVLQPYAPNHTQAADLGYWQWTGSSATLTLTWTGDQTVSCVGVLQHTLSGSATCTITLKNSGGSTLATVPLTVRSGPLVAFLDTTLTTVRSLVITLANATGMGLGWVYAGVPLSTSHQPTSCRIDRVYAIERGGGVNPRGAYLGAGRGGEIVWENWLLQEDLDALLTLTDAIKTAGDAPLCVVPNYRYPAEAALCRLDSDAIQVSDVFEFQADDSTRRRLSMTLPLTAVVL